MIETPYLDRDISEIQFNERVLELAADERVPLLERARYLIISFSNIEQLVEERGRKMFPKPAVQARMTMLRRRQNEVRKELESELTEKDLGIDFESLKYLHIPELLYPQEYTHVPPVEWEGMTMWERIPEGGMLKYHPYDSFAWVSDFVRNAAIDPTVQSISMTLYRVGNKSDIVDSLVRAAQEGKKVHVLLELKARLDEERNLTWASRLEFAGVKVSYGFMAWKTHAKLCVVKRKEGRKKPTLYSHVGTGNYNTTTADTYADFSLFTKDRDIGNDILKLFKWLSKPGRPPHFNKLIISPFELRTTLMRLIEEQSNPSGFIGVKMNSLTDKPMIDALYNAAQAGCRIHAIVRGACIMQPTDNIVVKSYVHRFLEHGRLFRFGEVFSDARVFISSSDFKPNALNDRVEQMTELHGASRHDAVDAFNDQWNNKPNSWYLQPDGEYVRQV